MATYLPGKSNPVTIKNVVWLETLHLTLPDRFLRIRHKDHFQTAPRMIKFLRQKFLFHVLQATKDELAIYVIRVDVDPDKELDNGYLLQFQISIIGFDEPAKYADMYCGEDIVNVLFLKRSIRKALKKQKKDYYIFDLKIVISLVECENLDNEERKRAEGILRLAKETILSREVAIYMALLLQRPNLEDVFTGRLDHSFTETKLSLILKSSFYSEEILMYLLAKREGQKVLPYINHSEILNYILNSDKSPISNEDVHVLYIIAHNTGMDFLIELVMDYMMTKMDDKLFVLDTMQVSNHVEDQIVFEKAAICFLNFYQDIRRTPIYSAILNSTGWVIRSIIHSCRRFVKTKSTWIPGWDVNRKF